MLNERPECRVGRNNVAPLYPPPEECLEFWPAASVVLFRRMQGARPGKAITLGCRPRPCQPARRRGSAGGERRAQVAGTPRLGEDEQAVAGA